MFKLGKLAVPKEDSVNCAPSDFLVHRYLVSDAISSHSIDILFYH